MSDIYSEDYLKRLYPNINFNAYVQLTHITKEDIERNTNIKKNKENISNSSNIFAGQIKKEYQEDANIEDYDGTIDDTTSQYSMQENGINIKIEDADLVEVKIEPEDEIINIQELTCKVCYEIFNTYEDLIVHTNIIHTSKPYVCAICNEQFVLSVHLSIHAIKHINDLCMRNSSLSPTEIQSSSTSNSTMYVSGNNNNSSSTLALAESSCNTLVNLLQNESNNLNKIIKSFKCINCVFATWSESKFLNHLDICNNISSSISGFHQCNLCSKSFNNRSAFNGHLKYHSFRSEIISRRQLASTKKKAKSQTKKKAKSQTNKSIVLQPQKSVCPMIPNFSRGHKCKDCNRNFSTRRKLNIHCQQHKQRLMCNQCNKKFVLQKNFEKHLLKHTNDKQSGKISFETSFNENNSHQKLIKLQHKLASNTNIINNTDDINITQDELLKKEKKFACFYCKNDYKSKQSLSQHNRQHHSSLKRHPYRNPKTKTVKCNWCSAIITKCNLPRHINRLHPNVKPIKCSFCPMAFKEYRSLKSHMSESHTN